jgi:hypothetical protein
MNLPLNVFKFIGAHFLIFKDGDDSNKYKALDTKTGTITVNDTDCGALLNTINSSLVSGDTVAFAAGDTYSGATDFCLTGTKTRVNILGNGAELNFKIKIMGSNSHDLYGANIRYFCFNGANAGVVINNTYQVCVAHCSFSTATAGISIECDVSYSEFYKIDRCYFKNCTTAIKFKTPTGTGTGSYVNGRIQDTGFDAFSGTTTPYTFIDIQSGAEVSEGHWDNLRLWFSLDNGTGIHIAGDTSRCSWSRFYFENFVSGNTTLKAVKNESTAETACWLDNPVYGGYSFNSKYDNAVGKWIDGISSIVRESSSITVGLSNVYSTAVRFMTQSALYTGMPRIYIIAGGKFSSETLSVQFQGFSITGETSGVVTKTFTATNTGTELGILDYDTLANLDNYIVDYIEVKAKTTKATSTAVTCTVRTIK